MGRKSLRFRTLERILLLYRNASWLFALEHLDQLIEGNIEEDLLDENNDLLLCVCQVKWILQNSQSRRHLAPHMCSKGSVSIFEEDLTTEGDMCWMNADEFLCKYRVTCNQLDQLTNILSEDDVFAHPKRGYPQMPVKHQLMIWLHFVGHEAQSNSTQRDTFKVSRGMCEKARDRIPSWFCVPAFKCVVGDGLHLHPHKTLFNTVLAKPRVVCEHTMGLWKGRFCWLRNIRMKITNNKNSIKRILRYIDSTIVFHNMLLDWREAEDRNTAWDESVVTDLTSIDDANRAPPIAEREVLDQPIPLHALNDMRRTQLMQYICETYIHSYNYSPIQDDLSLSHGDWSSMVGYDFSTDGDDSSVVSELD
eukprot:CCRYP_013419-RB/>CCRYP_013419-RB protein AED:0.20 eAED:0.10 QI:0/0/0/1/0/0/2/0/363